MAGTAWTPATEALLTRLWTVDSLSYGDIAAALTSHTGSPVTRNAVAVMGMPITEQDQEVRAATRENSAPAQSEPESGTWRLAELGPSQCRFACTPHNTRPEAHRFCGQTTRVGPGNLHGSWCPEHLPLVWSGAKTAGGASRADVEREHPTTRVA